MIPAALHGYAFGALYKKEFSVKQRKRWLLIIGGVATWLFIFIRAIDKYGEPQVWSRQVVILREAGVHVAASNAHAAELAAGLVG